MSRAAGGFPKDTLSFLESISANNEKAWFEAHRDLYEAGYVAPARSFVEAIGPRLQEIAPDIRFEPKINGSIGRINRDVRFGSDKRPYKDHLDLWFWHGDKKGWDQPGFYLRIAPDAVWLGSGMHGFGKELLAGFRDAVVDDRSGKALVAAATEVKSAGYELGGKARKQVPRGYDAENARAEYLLYEGLHAGTELPASAATRGDFADVCVGHFRGTWPIGKWLLDHVTG